MHPVMRKLIAVKWKIYGKTGAIIDLILNLIYTILWTVEGVTVPRHGNELYLPVRQNIWRIVIDSLLVLFTLTEIKKQIMQTINTRRELVKWREWRAEQLQQDKQYCHPRWPQEEKLLDAEIKAVKALRLASRTDNWVYFDWICLFLILSTIATSIMFFKEVGKLWKEINNRTTITMLLFSWLRMFKYARPFENAGPFVVIFSNVVGDILKWFVLNAIILIPFACAFWIEFGMNSTEPAKGYTDVASLLYNIFQMTIVGDYGWPELVKANETMARILCGSFILVAGIITLNLLIALVSNTFERHYENAVANAVMQRATTILLLQSRMGEKKCKRYYEFIKANASPQIVQAKYGGLMTACPEDRATIERVYDDLRQVKSVLDERFGRRYGKGNKSDLEIVREDLGKVKRSGRELAKDVKLILYGMGEQSVLPLYTGNRRDLIRMSNAGVPRVKKDDNESDEETDKSNNRMNCAYGKNDNNSNKKKENNKNSNNKNNNDDDDDDVNQYSSRPKITRKRNRSRRSKKLDISTSEASDSDDVTGFYATHFPKTRGYQEAVYWPRRRKGPEHSKPRRAGRENWHKGEYNEWSPYERFGEPRSQHFSPRSEYKYSEPQYGRQQTPICMYHSDHNSVPPMYHFPPPTSYFTDMPHQMRNQQGRFSPQPAQPPASSFKQPPGNQARPHTYPSHPNEYSDGHKYGRLSQPHDYLTQSEEFDDRLRRRISPRGMLSPQSTQSPACVVQPAPEIQAARHHSHEYSSKQTEYKLSQSQEYSSHPVDVSGQHGPMGLFGASIDQEGSQH